MKSKRLFQIILIFILMFISIVGSQSALASTNSPVQAEAMVINRNLNFWDATYIGYVSDSRHERWHFDFTETHTFVIAVSAISGDLVPLLILQDANGIEIARGTSTLTSTQPPGTYSIQIQPESGSGFYVLTLRDLAQTNPSVVTTSSPASVNVGETAVAAVSLTNVPAEGYTSAEFTCTYNPHLVEVGNPVATSLFGADPVVVVNGPQNGSFIVAIAGSNGSKATTSGVAFTFSVTGLIAGQSPVTCTARVSKGDNLLTEIASTGTNITVTGLGPTATFTPTAIGSPTATSSTPVASPTSASLTPAASLTATSLTPVQSATPTTSSTPVFTATATLPAKTATPTFTSTPLASPTFTSTPLPNGTISGQVIAGKPVTVSLFTGTTLVTSTTANMDGTFTLSVPAGTYTLRATASGFLSAEGSVTVTSGNHVSKPAIMLLAGDIDGNGIIDQFDAMTIGMSYNTVIPVAADLNNDNVINVLDLELLAKNYRATGPTAWN